MKTIKNLLRKPLFWSFAICLAYWAYLVSSSHIVISCDAAGYEKLGRLLQEKGWVEYFKTGPQREPLYPLLISLAMRLGKYLSVSYQPIIVIFQFLFIFFTQLLALRILRILKVRDIITALTILYLGISPAIVNSAVSLFSEIVTYPIILAILITNYYAWRAFNGPEKKTVMLSVISGILFCLITLTKAIFEVITPAFLITAFLFSLASRKKRFVLGALTHTVITLAVFYAGISAYKIPNKVFNHNFVITDRGDLKLYGTAIRRTEPLKAEQFYIALANIPGENFCQNIFGREKCAPWGFEEIDGIGYKKLAELGAEGFNLGQTSQMTVQLAIKKILKNPAQYTLFWAIEGVKLFCWESTRIGFVEYPPLLTKIFNLKIFKNGLRLILSLLTVIAVAYLAGFLWRERKVMFKTEKSSGENSAVFLLLGLLFIIIFIGVHSLVNTVPRYALPLAPLYLIVIALALQKVIFKSSP